MTPSRKKRYRFRRIFVAPAPWLGKNVSGTAADHRTWERKTVACSGHVFVDTLGADRYFDVDASADRSVPVSFSALTLCPNRPYHSFSFGRPNLRESRSRNESPVSHRLVLATRKFAYVLSLLSDGQLHVNSPRT